MTIKEQITQLIDNPGYYNDEGAQAGRMKFYRNADEFLAEIASLNSDDQVWRGEDGSYAVGDTFPIEVEEGGVEYIEAGKVSEYKHE